MKILSKNRNEGKESKDNEVPVGTRVGDRYSTN